MRSPLSCQVRLEVRVKLTNSFNIASLHTPRVICAVCRGTVWMKGHYRSAECDGGFVSFADDREFSPNGSKLKR